MRGASRGRLRIARSHTGWGVFARGPIAAGELLTAFEGPTISLADTVALGEHEGDPLQIGIDRYLDLEAPGVFFNHSCSPNAGLRRGRELAALRQIDPGEEIRWDYSTSMLERRWTLGCRCGSPRCRRVVLDFDRLPDRLQSSYLSLDIVSPYIRRALGVRGLAARPAGSAEDFGRSPFDESQSKQGEAHA